MKVEAGASYGSLAAHSSFMSVVWHWGLFGHEQKATEWVRQLASSDENFVKVIRQMRGEIRSHSLSDRIAIATPHVDCENLGKFVPTMDARRRAAALLTAGPDWLTAEDRKSLQVVVASIGEDGTVHDNRAGRGRKPVKNGDGATSKSESKVTQEGEATDTEE